MASLKYTKVAQSAAAQILVTSPSVPVFPDAWRLISWLGAGMFFKEEGVGSQEWL